MISKEKQDRIYELRKGGMKIDDISKEVGVSVRTVGSWCNKFGLNKLVDLESRRKQFLETISKYAGDDWEYYDGFVSTRKPVQLRCKHCGHIQTFSADSIRQWSRNDAPTVCESCSEEKSRIAAIIYASHEYARESTFEHQCPVCKRWIASDALYCSASCQHRAAQLRSYESRKENFQSKLVKCRNCGKEFWTQFKGNKVFCSDECRRKYARHNSRVYRRTRKMLIHDAMVDNDITLPKLIERDHGICQICGGQVDTDDYSYDDNGNFIVGHDYPSIDHVVPLSKGGKHSWSNVQLAHCYCNTLKNDNI